MTFAVRRWVFLIAGTLFSASMVEAAWHPVRVYRDESDWPHHFEVWNGGGYENKILMGYSSIDFGTDEDPIVVDSQAPDSYNQRFRALAADNVNFVRLWLRPSDGHYAYEYDRARGQVAISDRYGPFFVRLDRILQVARAHSIILEIMLWDTSTGWSGVDLREPTTWRTCWAGVANRCDCPNVHHPDNHFRSQADPNPIPGVSDVGCDKIGNNTDYDFWFSTAEGPDPLNSPDTWFDYQRQYVRRVMEVVTQYDNVTLEVINEAPGNSTEGIKWRKAMHEWLRESYPDIVLQSEATGPVTNASDQALRYFGTQERGVVDMVSSHAPWTYDSAQAQYKLYRGVVPGCNEAGDGAGFQANDLEYVRRFMWGLTLGGGAAYVENVVDPNIGGAVTTELHRYFYPPEDPPTFWEMRPDKDLVRNNAAGERYVLAKDDASEILVFSPGEEEFEINGAGQYRYRWFRADGGNSFWESWHHDSNWLFSPPGVNSGLQIQFDPNAGPTCEEMGAGWFVHNRRDLCETSCGGPDSCVKKRICGANGELCQPEPNYCWRCPGTPVCGNQVCEHGENCLTCADCMPCAGRTCGEMGPGWYYPTPDQTAACEASCGGPCWTKQDCGGLQCLAPDQGLTYCVNCPSPGGSGGGDDDGDDGDDGGGETNSCGSQGFYAGDDKGSCDADCGEECSVKFDCGGLPCEAPGYCWRC